MGVVILDRQHGWKSASGGWQTGVVAENLVEVAITRKLCYLMWAALEQRGHRVFLLTAGRYEHRHLEANDIARTYAGESCAYVAQHINSIRGDTGRGAYFYDFRSHGGERLATVLAEAMEGVVPDNKTVRTWSAYNDANEDNGWLYNPWYTVNGIYEGPNNISGVCSEPMRIQGLLGLSSTETDQQLGMIAAAQARGLHSFLVGKTTDE